MVANGQRRLESFAKGLVFVTALWHTSINEQQTKKEEMMGLDKEAIKEAFNYDAALRYANEVLPRGEYDDAYDGDVDVYEVTDEGALRVAFGGYTIYGKWEIMDEHEGFWAELKPVGGLDADGCHADYEMIDSGEC